MRTLTVETFSEVRLADLFPGDAALESRAGSFDWEQDNELWGVDEIPGAKMLFPRTAPGTPGVPELEACKASNGWLIVRGRQVRPTVDPVRAANADRVLAALGLGVRMGAPAAAVEALAAGPVRREPWDNDPDRSYVTFDHGPFHMHSVVSAADGLLRLEITRLDLHRANDFGL